MGNVKLGSYTFSTAFISNPGGANSDSAITSVDWRIGAFNVDINADADSTDNPGDVVNFALADPNSDGLYTAMYVSVADASYVEGNVSDQSATDGDDETVTGTENVTIGANYSFVAAFDNNPANDSDDARITSRTRFEGTFLFDAETPPNGALETDGSNTIYFGLTDVTSDGVYNTMDLSLGEAADSQVFGQGGLLTDQILAAAGTNDERFGSADTPRRITVGEYSVDVDFKANPPAAGTIGGTSVAEDQDATIFHIVDPGTIIVYSGLESWTIDADGDEVTDDHVFFLLSATGSTAVVDTIDISIGDTVFGEIAVGTLTDGIVNYAETDNTNDERATGSIAGGVVTIASPIQLGTHYFNVEFDQTGDRR